MSRETPRFSGDDDGSIDPVERAAADWLVLEDRGLSSAQRLAFDQWLRSDERHARIYAQLSQTWGQLDRVPSTALPLPPFRRRWKQVWAFGALGAAATIALMWGIAGSRQSTAEPLVRHAATPVGGFQKIDLPDGSVVSLNTASAVEVAFSAAERRVRLTQGEATFEVAKDVARPFVVRVGEVDVRAVGTVFSIRRRTDTVEVLVTEGKVRVDDVASGQNLVVAGQAGPKREGADSASEISAAASAASTEDPVLTAGQRLTVSTAPNAAKIADIVVLAPEAVARTLAWQSRRVEFDLEPLESIVAEFNRYNRHQLVIADPRLAQRRFGGKFPADDFESFVRSLETTFDVLAERREDETLLRLRR